MRKANFGFSIHQKNFANFDYLIHQTTVLIVMNDLNNYNFFIGPGCANGRSLMHVTQLCFNDSAMAAIRCTTVTKPIAVDLSAVSRITIRQIPA